MLSDVDCIRTHVYVYRHKLHPKPARYMEGTNEVHVLIDQLEDMVNGERPEKKAKKMFTKKPAMCFGNYCKRGFGLMFTTRHSHLPNVPAEYLCKT
eukprot:10575495-Ditylum_brightwellii.AAC.1